MRQRNKARIEQWHPKAINGIRSLSSRDFDGQTQMDSLSVFDPRRRGRDDCGRRIVSFPLLNANRKPGVSSISSEFRDIVCVFNACVSMCVLNVLIRDQRANLCAKWNIYAWQLDTSEQRDYWDTVSR